MTFKDIIAKYSDVYEINDEKYTCCVLLFNAIGNICKLTSQSIYSLIIEDNYYSPFFSGVLNIKNDSDALEMSNIPELKSLASSFKSINNGQDYVFIYFSQYDKNKLQNINLPSLNLVGMFVIVSSEDIYIQDQKIKSFALRDINEQRLSEINGIFTTSKYAYKIKQDNNNPQDINTYYNKISKIDIIDKTNITQLSNEDRMVSTGQAIALLLREILPDSYIDNTNWDFGGPLIFYSSNPNESYLDTLKILLDLHNARSIDHDKCYLSYYYDLEKNLVNWQFTSISDDFKNLKSNNTSSIIEMFELSIKDFSYEKTNDETLDKYIIKSINYGGKTSTITNFFISDLSTDNNLNYIKSKSIYNYNYTTKEFFIDNESSNFKNTLQSFKDNYVSDEIIRYPNTPISLSQLYNYNAEHIINKYNEDTNISIGRNDLLKKLITLNNSIEFNLQGNIIRQSGYFVSLKMNNAPADNQFLNKVLGECFITNITHKFQDKSYINNIVVSKPFYLTKPWGFDEFYKIKQ